MVWEMSFAALQVANRALQPSDCDARRVAFGIFLTSCGFVVRQSIQVHSSRQAIHRLRGLKNGTDFGVQPLEITFANSLLYCREAWHI